MPDPLQDASAGQPSPFVNKRDTVNAVLESARDWRSRRLGTLQGQTANNPKPPICHVWVRNDTGGTLAAGAILTLGTPVISAVTYPYRVNATPLFPGTAPAATADSFAILVEPAADGAIALAAILGLVVCNISVSNASHVYATPTAASTSVLTSAMAGPARIIWKETGTGTKRAVVLLGSDLGYSTVQEEGSDLPRQPTLNFVGGGFTAVDDAGNSRTNVNLDAELNALASTTSAVDALPYFNGSGSATTTTLTSFGRSLIDDANAAAALTTLGVSSFVQTLLDDADAATALATLGVTGPQWTKYTFNYTSFTAAGTTEQVTLFTLPIRGMIHQCVQKHSTQFAAPGLASLTTLIGIVGNSSKFCSSLDVSQVVSATAFRGSGPLTADPESFSGTTAITVYGTSSGANLNTLTAGVLEVDILASTLP